MPEMINIKITLMYDGSNYSGWQRLGRQNRKPSIQAVLEERISACLGEEIRIIGSGRTDAGTHALRQVANFHCHIVKPAEDMRKEINILLPEDIAILELEEAEKDFHSRYRVKAKTYEYRIDMGEKQNVFTRKYTCHVPGLLNLGNMERASEYFIGSHDFKAFSTDRKDNKSTVRTVESITFTRKENELRIAVTGNGFLYNMVRIIAGTLIEVGEGIRRPEDMADILAGRDRSKAGPTASSHALFLYDVRY